MPRRNRENSHLPVEGWTNWIWAMAPEKTTRVWNLKTRRNHQGYRNTNIAEELWEENDNVTRLCGINEWRATQSFGSDPIVVYVGSTCSRNGGPCTRMKNRIVSYCKHGNHKSDHINKALSRGYELWVRFMPTGSEKEARKMEDYLLGKYDYAWNKRKNGKIRNIL